MKIRNWVFTLNNYTDDDCVNIQAAKTKYLVYGKEVGESGTPHLQGLVTFHSQKTMSAVKKCLKCRGLHLEPMKGSFKEASDYCKKDGDVFESGEMPMDPKVKGETEKKRYQRAWELAKQGDIEEIDADIRVRLYGTIKRIHSDYQPQPKSIDKLDFWWFYGESETGKSRTAREENPVHYLKRINKWWDGYVDQPCVIIEEWSPDVVGALQQMLKEWCDHHPFAAEIKGGTTCLRPPKIIVTSNYTLEECFGHDQRGLYLPLKRRFQVKVFKKLITDH